MVCRVLDDGLPELTLTAGRFFGVQALSVNLRVHMEAAAQSPVGVQGLVVVSGFANPLTAKSFVTHQAPQMLSEGGQICFPKESKHIFNNHIIFPPILTHMTTILISSTKLLGLRVLSD